MESAGEEPTAQETAECAALARSAYGHCDTSNEWPGAEDGFALEPIADDEPGALPDCDIPLEAPMPQFGDLGPHIEGGVWTVIAPEGWITTAPNIVVPKGTMVTVNEDQVWIARGDVSINGHIKVLGGEAQDSPSLKIISLDGVIEVAKGATINSGSGRDRNPVVVPLEGGSERETAVPFATASSEDGADGGDIALIAPVVVIRGEVRGTRGGQGGPAMASGIDFALAVEGDHGDGGDLSICVEDAAVMLGGVGSFLSGGPGGNEGPFPGAAQSEARVFGDGFAWAFGAKGGDAGHLYLIGMGAAPAIFDGRAGLFAQGGTAGNGGGAKAYRYPEGETLEGTDEVFAQGGDSGAGGELRVWNINLRGLPPMFNNGSGGRGGEATAGNRAVELAGRAGGSATAIGGNAGPTSGAGGNGQAPGPIGWGGSATATAGAGGPALPDQAKPSSGKGYAKGGTNGAGNAGKTKSSEPSTKTPPKLDAAGATLDPLTWGEEAPL